MNIVTTCDPPGGPVTTDNTGCSVASNGLYSYERGSASASGSATLTLASNPADYSSLSVQQAAYATGRTSDAPNAGALWIPASADSQVSFAETLVTAGTAWAGYIEVVSSGGSSFDPGNSSGSGAVTGPQALDGSSLSVTCYPIEGGCEFQTPERILPFELGTAFSLSYTGYVLADSDNDVDGPSGRSMGLNYQFRFFEADGVTPVAVSETPEPATFALLGYRLPWL